MNRICYWCKNKILETDKVSHGLHSNCFQKAFSVEEGVDFTNVAIRHQASDGDPNKNNRSKHTTSFFHGKFRKYSAVLGSQNYILKVQEDKYEELPVTEYLCNQIARLLGINVPKFALIEFQGSITAFATRNFMKDYSASNLVHIYHFIEEEKNWNCKNIITQIEKQTKRLHEVERFIEICLFDALIGNNDRHGRNLALIHQRQKYTLSPFYDNPSNIGIELEALLEAMLEPKGSIAVTETEEPSMKDYVLEFKQLGYQTVCSDFLNNVQKNLNEIKNQINTSFLSERRKQALKGLMNRRYKELLDNV